MNLCEMKYSQEEFIIDKEFSETIRERTQLFRREQKTTKNLRCTLRIMQRSIKKESSVSR